MLRKKWIDGKTKSDVTWIESDTASRSANGLALTRHHHHHHHHHHLPHLCAQKKINCSHRELLGSAPRIVALRSMNSDM